MRTSTMAPYNNLLCVLFPASSRPTIIDGGADFIIISFEITLRPHPVLILEVEASPAPVAQFNTGRSRQADSPPLGRFVRWVASLRIALS